MYRTSNSANEAHNGNADRNEDRLLDEEITVGWAALEERNVPANVHLSEYIQADSCTVVHQDMIDEDIITVLRRTKMTQPRHAILPHRRLCR